MKKIVAEVNGMFVQNCWVGRDYGKVMLSTRAKDVDQSLGKDEIKWLKENFENVKLYELTSTLTEIGG